MAEQRKSLAQKVSGAKKSAQEVMDEWERQLKGLPPVSEMPSIAAGKILQGGAAVGDAAKKFAADDNARFGNFVQGATDLYNSGGQGYASETAGKIGNAALGAIQGGYDKATDQYDRGAYAFMPGEAAGYGMVGDAANAINQFGYDVRLGAQQGRFPPNPPAPYVGANRAMGNITGQASSDIYSAQHPQPYGMMMDDATILRQAQVTLQQTGQQLTPENVMATAQQIKQAVIQQVQAAQQGAQPYIEQGKKRVNQGMDWARGLLQ